MEKIDTQKIAMSIIAGAGEGRSMAFEALQYAKEGEFTKSDECLNNAENSIKQAHVAQTELLVLEANEKSIQINVLLIHSQDHLMTAELALDLIKEMITILKEKS